MGAPIDHTSLHRTAKYFMDNGRAETHDAAMALLKQFGLTIHAGPELASSADHQTALLTLVNLARRTLLGGVEVVGLPAANCASGFAAGRSLAEAVRELGGRVAASSRPEWPSAVIGNASPPPAFKPSWRLTWEGWRGGVVPVRDGRRLAEDTAIGITPALAAAACAAEVFVHHAGDHLFAGRRPLGLSLWRPGADWLAPDPGEPTLAYLPSRLWIIGLGNLGQAFAWLLAALPYGDPRDVQLVLQDFDRIARSNDSTSLLSFVSDIGRRKARVVADWLDARGFETFIEERRFGTWTRRDEYEPSAAFCGVDNALARAALEEAGFDLVVEAGLGAGPQAFRSIALHTFPSSRRAADIWSKQVGDDAAESMENMPAYQKLKREGMDPCGLTQLASRTVGVPFVGLIAGCLAMSELLRRLHGGPALEFASGSVSALEDLETGRIEAGAYAFGYVPVSGTVLNVPERSLEMGG
jgi:hypothetical protein